LQLNPENLAPVDLLEAASRANEAVEWLAIAWLLTERGLPDTANPHLLPRLRELSAPLLEQAVDLSRLAALRERIPRDRFVKQLVLAAYGEFELVVPDEFELLLFATELLCVKESLRELLASEFDEAETVVAELVGDFDPAEDLSRIVGDSVAATAVFVPSLFMAPPQRGRHGVLIERESSAVMHLHFGLPLRQSLSQHFITPQSLRTGGWHYAIQYYLQQHWPQLEARLDALPGLGDAFLRGAADNFVWPKAVRGYVSHALKILLDMQSGLPKKQGLLLAQARGAVHTEWFMDWILGSVRERGTLGEALEELPEVLLDKREEFEARRVPTFVPKGISLALMNSFSRDFFLVCPDDWADDSLKDLRERWDFLGKPEVLRHTDWLKADGPGPLLAVGPPGSNPLVADLLTQRGLSLESLPPEAPMVVTLGILPGSSEESIWAIAVAIRDESCLHRVTPTRLSTLGVTHVLFDGDRVVHKEVHPDLLDRL